MISRRCVLPLAILVLGLTWSCSSGPDPNGPEAAVQSFVDHLNDGDYDAAKALYNAEALALVDDPEFGSDDAFREWADKLTRNGTVRRVEFVHAEVGENDGTVEFRIVYRDGSSNPGKVAVSREDGRWKVGLFG